MKLLRSTFALLAFGLSVQFIGVSNATAQNASEKLSETKSPGVARDPKVNQITDLTYSLVDGKTRFFTGTYQGLPVRFTRTGVIGSGKLTIYTGSVGNRVRLIIDDVKGMEDVLAMDTGERMTVNVAKDARIEYRFYAPDGKFTTGAVVFQKNKRWWRGTMKSEAFPGYEALTDLVDVSDQFALLSRSPKIRLAKQVERILLSLLPMSSAHAADRRLFGDLLDSIKKKSQDVLKNAKDTLKHREEDAEQIESQLEQQEKDADKQIKDAEDSLSMVQNADENTKKWLISKGVAALDWAKGNLLAHTIVNIVKGPVAIFEVVLNATKSETQLNTAKYSENNGYAEASGGRYADQVAALPPPPSASGPTSYLGEMKEPSADERRLQDARNKAWREASAKFVACIDSEQLECAETALKAATESESSQGEKGTDQQRYTQLLELRDKVLSKRKEKDRYAKWFDATTKFRDCAGAKNLDCAEAAFREAKALEKEPSEQATGYRMEAQLLSLRASSKKAADEAALADEKAYADVRKKIIAADEASQASLKKDQAAIKAADANEKRAAEQAAKADQAPKTEPNHFWRDAIIKAAVGAVVETAKEETQRKLDEALQKKLRGAAASSASDNSTYENPASKPSSSGYRDHRCDGERICVRAK